MADKPYLGTALHQYRDVNVTGTSRLFADSVVLLEAPGRATEGTASVGFSLHSRSPSSHLHIAEAIQSH